MLQLLGRTHRYCGGLSRRDVLHAAGAGLLGVGLPRVWAAEQIAPTHRARAKSVLFMFLFGGPSQLETLDMKPEAPEGIRGPFKPIASRTPELLVCEHLPQMAQISDRFAVVRTVTHPQNDHNACHYIQTGRPMPIAPRGAAGVDATDKDWPAIGSVVEYLDQRAAGELLPEMPSYVYVPNRLGHIQGYDRLGQYAGWLGRGYNALATEIRKRDGIDNPYFRECSDEELDFRLKGLEPQTDMTLDRLNSRLSLLEQFDAARRTIDRCAATADLGRMRERALALLTSPRIREAFDIRQEPAKLRDRYGRRLFGQSALLGRRLIEAGARFVTVLWDCPEATVGTATFTATTSSSICCPAGIRPSRLCWPISTTAGCSMIRWSSAWARWAARRKATPAGAATTGAIASPPCWPAPAYAVAPSTVGPTLTPPFRPRTRSAPKIWPPPFSTPWASIPSCAFQTPKAARRRWSSTAGRWWSCLGNRSGQAVRGIRRRNHLS